MTKKKRSEWEGTHLGRTTEIGQQETKNIHQPAQKPKTRHLSRGKMGLGMSDAVDRGQERGHRGFPGGALAENLPANAGDRGSSPGLGRSHVPRSN